MTKGNNNYRTGEILPDSQNLASQFELLKLVSELNHEMLFDYDVDEGLAMLYEVKNGRFVLKREESRIQDIWIKYADEIEAEDIPVLARCFENMRHRIMQNVVEFRLSFEKKEKKWYRFFLVSESTAGNGHVDHIAGRLVCIDQEKQANEMNRKKAELDALSGVYNHKTFEQLAETKLLKHKSEIIFIMLDIDDFKRINDTQGHHVGDMVISQTGEVFQRMVRRRGISGRLGGDEFAAIVWSFHNDDEIKEYMKNFQAELKTIIFDLEYSASIGVSIRHGRNMSFKDMYYEADQGAYHAKKNGKNQIIFFDQIEELQKDEMEGLAQNITLEESSIKAYEELPEKILIVDKENYSILYANSKFEEYYQMSFQELVEKGPIADILCMKPEELIVLQKDENYFTIKASKDNAFYNRIRKTGEAICQTNLIHWMGEEAIAITIMTLDDAGAISTRMKRRAKVNNILLKTIDIIASVSEHEEKRAHEVLQLLVDFFDADCIAVIMPRIEDGKEMVMECHQEHSSTIAKLFCDAVERGSSEIFDSLFPDEGIEYVSDISCYKEKSQIAYDTLVSLQIWSSVTGRLCFQGERVGKLVMVNPRKHLEQRTLIRTITNLIAEELLRNKREFIREFEENHDSLTGLLSRDCIVSMQELWDVDKKASVGVLYADIVDLSRINNTYGYSKGNEFIQQEAEVLKEVFKGYHIFRFEQDCMLVVCDGVNENIFDMMIQTAKEKFDELPFGVAVGYSWGNFKPLGQYIEEAKDVMESNKLLQKEEDIFTKEQQKAMTDIEQAISKGNFQVYLQPKMNIRTDTLVGAEALIRYVDEERGVIGPGLFIPVLENLDLVYLADLFVMEEVFKFQRSRIDRGLHTVPVSVNISKRTLIYSELLKKVSEMVEKYNIPSELIEVEITESIGDLDHAFVAKIAKSLHSMGFLLAMDDFGTKYSNLSMLSRFDFEVAKIDRSIIVGLSSNPKSFTILKHLTSMIRELGIACMVEGVETQEDLDFVKETDCDVVQGYFYSKPIPVFEFETKFM